MSVIWHKVWRDLAHNKLRTLLAVLSTAVGVFALGLVFGMSGVMRDRMTESHRATLPAHINLWGGPFDQAVVEAVLREPGVADVELEIWRIPFRWKLEGETEWRDGDLYAREDYDAQRMDLIDLLDGYWPARHTLAVERQSSEYFGLPLGTAILVEIGQRERRVPIEGDVRAPFLFSPQLGSDAAFFATSETITWLTGREGFDDLYIRLESFSEEKAEETAERIKDRLERMGLSVGGPWIRDPDVHFAQEQVDALLLILGVLGALSLGLSAFLIVNTTNAIVTQQVWQIGVMKVVGATTGRVARIYLMAALVYGLLALLLAVPLGAVGAHFMAGFLLDFMSIDSGPLRLTPATATVQLAMGLIVPMLAALVPVIGGARISPHACISNYGLGAGFGRGWLDRLIGQIHFLSRPMMLSLRNTFRRKARVALTLLTLTLGGVMFIMIMSVDNSFSNTIEMQLDTMGYDVQIGFDRLHPVARLTEIAESVPGVTRAEVWNWQGATLALASGEERSISIMGAPPNSAIYAPRVVSGRRLLPNDERAILLNHEIAVEEGIGVGDEIALTIDRRESVWTVVGLVLNIWNSSQCVAPFDVIAREAGHVNRGSTVAVLSERRDAESQRALLDGLRDNYAAHHIEVSWSQSASEIRERNRSQFSILTYLLLSMAVLAAAVGSLGLMGTMSINVVERGREIGVMRATGATSVAIVGIVVGEGVLLGVLSWLLAVPLSYPSAQILSSVVGDTLMNLPLDFSYSMGGAAIWLGAVVVMSALASLWPALRATKVSVREALAYE